jgi:hypothetical protein
VDWGEVWLRTGGMERVDRGGVEGLRGAVLTG